MVAPILVFAVGNESRGDDALAPILLRKLSAQIDPEEVELLEDFQLQVEHALDMHERKLVLFIDAGLDTKKPYNFFQIESGDTPVLYSHALTPEAVVSTFRQLYQKDPPPSFVMCIQGKNFELGKELSADAQENLDAALVASLKLLSKTDIKYWLEMSSSRAIP